MDKRRERGKTGKADRGGKDRGKEKTDEM